MTLPLPSTSESADTHPKVLPLMIEPDDDDEGYADLDDDEVSPDLACERPGAFRHAIGSIEWWSMS